ncbi:endoribonuclease L-PSP protein [Rhizobium etli bv. mimosae str. IE4771]|uniref:Endoribonuclease L-PSP protein n=1 Tax=Rhizobium etli bv. mimosae str. IE4771 TaxID=1432050 RepID=A0A060I6P3_RHIET|nr:RidA family protein [Rhizobium sp. IE4771]AIC27201.1 endoribonuclease L-PSP protein [Rhizobium sp. IE4771]
MSNSVESRLEKLGIALPEAAKSVANYVGFVLTGKLLMTSGQLPLHNGEISQKGLIGGELDVEAGRAAAERCAINVLAQAKAALGSLDEVRSLVKITVFVASAPDFTSQHLVANGASDLFVAAFGDAGIHARSAVGVAALPFNAPVEIEAVFEVA